MQELSKIFDGLLVLQYLGGDQKALGLLVKRHHYRLCRHAHWYTRDTETAKDIVQECWKSVISGIGTLKDPNKFGSWAMTIVTRKSIDHMKRQKKERENTQEEKFRLQQFVPDVPETTDERLVMLKEAIAQLSREHQLVLQLFYLRGHSLIEIAAILDISVGTVKSRLFHSREKLKSLLNLK